jgi:sugar/nucleoside kinase (ribokinase family)
MEACGISLEFTTWVERPLPVITAGISFPRDRLFISYAAPEDPSDPEPPITLDLLEKHRPRVLFAYGEHGPELYREARRRGTFVYIDSHWNIEALHSSGIPQVLREVDVFSPNLAEACEITMTGTAEEALDVLEQWCRCIVVKAGARGCVASRDGKRVEVPALPVQAVETTGAGDNFNAGFLYGILHGYTFETCLRCANITGSLSTLVLGGAGSGVTAADIEERLRQPVFVEESR